MADIRAVETAKLVAQGVSVPQAMRLSGYAKTTADNQKVKQLKDWNTILEKEMGDKYLAREHKKIINAGKLLKEELPLGPKTQEDKIKLLASDRLKAETGGYEYIEKDYLTDDEIKEMYEKIDCPVQRILRGEEFRHVYYISPDNKTKKEGVEMAYKLKGRYKADDVAVPVTPNVDTENAVFNVLNVFLNQQNRLKGDETVENDTPQGDMTSDNE